MTDQDPHDPNEPSAFARREALGPTPVTTQDAVDRAFLEDDIVKEPIPDGIFDAAILESGLVETLNAQVDSSAKMRQFETGATRNLDSGKLDYEGFLSPEVIDVFARYMHKHRKQADGNLRASDNWQRGIPKAEYMKSLWRHFMDLWKIHRGLSPRETLEDAVGGIIFNVQGYLFEVLKERKEARVQGVLRDIRIPTKM